MEKGVLNWKAICILKNLRVETPNFMERNANFNVLLMWFKGNGSKSTQKASLIATMNSSRK